MFVMLTLRGETLFLKQLRSQMNVMNFDVWQDLASDDVEIVHITLKLSLPYNTLCYSTTY